MLATQRMVFILKEINRNGSVKLKEICKALDTSESTIRRDLEELEKQNKLRRVHGGAIKESLNSILNESKELPMLVKKDLQKEVKTALCAKCASIIEDGDCIFIDGGTTFMNLLPHLEGKKVKVITHSDCVRSNSDSIEVIVLGGRNLNDHQMNVGPLTLQQLSKFSFDKAFIGCAGVDVTNKDAFTAEMDSAQVKEIAIAQSILTYLVVDNTKLGRKGFYRFACTDDFTEVFINKTEEEREVWPNYTFI